MSVSEPLLTTTEDSSNPYSSTYDFEPTTPETIPNATPAATPNKFSAQFLPRFLPISYYIVYFLLTSMQELPMTSISWIINNETKFSPAELTIYYNFCFLPWVIKPLWGFIADNIPICGYRRKPYMIFFSWLASAVFIAVPIFSTDKTIMRVLGVLAALCVVFSEVQIDGLVVMFSNSLVDQQRDLFKQFPEFEQLMEWEKKSKEEKQKAEEEAAAAESQSSSNPNPHYTPTQIDEDNDYYIHDSSSSKSQLNEFDDNDAPLLINRSSPITPTQPTSTTTITTSPKANQYTTTDAIFEAKPHYSDILTSAEFTLLRTQLPKAAIQSEAMTVRTASSLVASLISLVLHLFEHPRIVVYICSTLPIILSVCVAILVPERNDNTFKIFTARMRAIKSALVPFQPIAESESSFPSSTINNVIDPRTLAQMDEPFGISKDPSQPPSLSCWNYVWSRVKAMLSAILLIWKPLLFMLLLRSMPTTTDPMMSYIFGHLTLPPWLLSAYGFISVAGGLLGSIMYWKLFTNVKLVPAFLIFTILGATVGTFPYFVLTDEWIKKVMHLTSVPVWALVFTTTFVGAFIGRLSLMPSLILAAETAPQHFGLEATMFSVYTATNNLGNMISTVSNVYLIKKLHISFDDFSKLSKMTIICAIASVVPLIFTPLLWFTQRDIKRLEAKRAAALLEKENEQEKLMLEREQAREIQHLQEIPH